MSFIKPYFLAVSESAFNLKKGAKPKSVWRDFLSSATAAVALAAAEAAIAVVVVVVVVAAATTTPRAIWSDYQTALLESNNNNQQTAVTWQYRKLYYIGRKTDNSNRNFNCT